MAVQELAQETEWLQPSRGLAHERPSGETVEWYTPPDVFKALGLHFDLDPASPLNGPVPWVPADRFYTSADDGLLQDWEGKVWLNPPYGRTIPAWLDRLDNHRNGIALVFARTDTRWFHRYVRRADQALFVYDRLYFVRSDGFQARGPAGSLMLAWGDECAAALHASGLGTLVAA